MVEKETKKVPIERIHPNSWNPFSMKPQLFEALVKHIQKEGLMGSTYVRPCECPKIEGSHFEIIDGENRWMAAKDRRINLSEMECLVGAKSDVDARLETINFNLEHGEIVREKFEAPNPRNRSNVEPVQERDRRIDVRNAGGAHHEDCSSRY